MLKVGLVCRLWFWEDTNYYGDPSASLVSLLFSQVLLDMDYHENANAAAITLLSIRGNCLNLDKPTGETFFFFFYVNDVPMILSNFYIMSSFCWTWKNLHIYIYFLRGCWHTRALYWVINSLCHLSFLCTGYLMHTQRFLQSPKYLQIKGNEGIVSQWVDLCVSVFYLIIYVTHCVSELLL